MRRLAVALLLLISAASAHSQTTTYYITNGDAEIAYIVQGGTIQSTFPIHRFGYPLAVGSTVRISHRDYQNGAEYTLAGTPTGTTYPGTGGFTQLLDGTTDGVQYNYAIECCGTTNSVIRTDLNWQGAAVLFDIPGNLDGTGIAYDTSTDHLFVSVFDDNLIREFDLSGTLVNSFTAPEQVQGLAYEEATDTIWGYTQGGTLYQFSTAGVLLDTIVLASGFGNAYGGEMAITGAAAGAPELTATKIASGDFVPGGQIAYTVVITNEGTAAQPDNVGDEFVDVLPNELILVSAEADSGVALANVGTNTVTWNGAIAAGESVTITIDARVNAGPGQEISNQGTVFFDADNNGTNESSNVTDDPNNATGDDDPTVVVVGDQTVAGIPTMSEYGLAVFALMLALAGAVVTRLRG